MFTKKKIKTRTKRSRSFKQTKYSKKKNKKSFFIFKWILFLIISFLLFSFILWLVLYKKYIEPLPPVEEIKNMNIAQTSIIYDKSWNELYKIFKENRTYVDFNNISENMINALVAWEDQRFWTNPWFDLIWIARATLFWITSWDFKWTSGLSQQLMKVTYLTNERTMERKVKEFYLSWKLNKVFDKEKIVELYLNKIFFWSNAYWIEQASKTFFWINSSDLNILQSSILSSLPKAPSGLSPYSHKDKLLGYPFVIDSTDKEFETKILTKNDMLENKTLLNELILFLDNLEFKKVNDIALICNVDKELIKPWTFRVDSDGCISIWFDKLLNFLNAIKITSGDNVLEYQTWRKDYILWRMLEDNYIDFDTYKKSLIDSFGFEFRKYRTNIKHPYFVMYVKDYLERKYGKEIVEQWWLRVFTTLDSDLQNKAEELVDKYWSNNEAKFWAKNTAMISLDNKTWGILTMVWWRDYFDEENGWNNNMVTSRLQPGSTFKPFAYALAIKNNAIWSKTPVFDLKTTFPWSYIPNNFDWEFEWKMNISTALNTSRNIPAIKMFYLAGWEEKLISFMEKLWVKSLRAFKEEYKEKYPWRTYSYAAPMALWTWLMTPLELASAYSTFANLWIKKEINPVIKIIDRKWNVIEDRDIWIKNTEPVILPSLAYIMNNILSDTSTRPDYWNKFLSLPWIKIAAKTWTSTKQYNENGKKVIAPRNLWTIWYTPQVTTVVWSWNTNWKELYLSWNGLESAWPVMRDFMSYYHKWKKVESWKKPIWVKSLKVSNISWLLPWEDLSENLFVDSNFVNAPTVVDNSLRSLSIDNLCNWKVTSSTPISAISEWFLLNFQSINPKNSSWESSVQQWFKTWIWKEEYWNILNVITNYNDTVCNRNSPAETVIKTSLQNDNTLFIWNNTIDLAYRSDRGIRKIEIYVWGVLMKTVYSWNKYQQWMNLSFPIPASFSNTTKTLKFRLIDTEFYSYDEDISVKILQTDNIAPLITLSNPWVNFTLKSWENLNISWTVTDTSSIKNLRYYLNSSLLKSSPNSKIISYDIDSSLLKSWENIFIIEATDTNINTGVKTIKINLEEQVIENIEEESTENLEDEIIE